MREYIISLIIIVAFLGSYTALVYFSNKPQSMHAATTTIDNRTPSSQEPAIQD